MAGIAEEKTIEERSKAFDLKAGAPLDSREVISTKTALSTELPIAQRYVGQSIFILDEKREYIFLNGITETDLEKNMLIKSFTLDIAVDLSVEDTFTFLHNLNTIELFVKVLITGGEIKQISSLLDPLDAEYSNSIILDFTEWKASSGLTELPVGTKIIILY